MKKFQKWFFWFCAVAVFALAGCAPKVVEIRLPEIAYGQDLCDACNMVIDDPRFAAAILLENGKYLKFDDIGDMLSYKGEGLPAPALAYYVHDYYSEEWLLADEAFFVQSSSLPSPMGYGLAAFASKDVAAQFASQFMADILTFDELESDMPRSHMHH